MKNQTGKRISRPMFLIGMLGLFLIALLGLFSVAQTRRYNHYVSQQTAMVKKQSQDALIKSQVESALSMLQGLSDKVKAGQMTSAAAQKMGADLLRGMRYGQDGYFFADTAEGVNVVLYGRKDVEGKNRLNDQIHGVYYVKEIIARAKGGGGYTDYWYTKQGSNKLSPKRAYSLYFEPFNWVVGTGYYVE